MVSVFRGTMWQQHSSLAVLPLPCLRRVLLLWPPPAAAACDATGTLPAMLLLSLALASARILFFSKGYSLFFSKLKGIFSIFPFGRSRLDGLLDFEKLKFWTNLKNLDSV